MITVEDIIRMVETRESVGAKPPHILHVTEKQYDELWPRIDEIPASVRFLTYPDRVSNTWADFGKWFMIVVVVATVGYFIAEYTAR